MRLRTRGDALLFRLPVHLDELLTRLAERDGVPRTVCAEQILVDYLETQQDRAMPGRPVQNVLDTSAAQAMLADLTDD